MPGHINPLVPLGCPHCQAELTSTLEDIQDEAFILCSRCGAVIDLQEEGAGRPADHPSEFQYESFWLEF